MPKIDIGIDPPQTPSVRTFLVVGETRSGKTTLVATFPAVYWIGSAREDGAEAIRWMDRSLWYERNRPPIARAVSTIAEVNAYLNEAVALVERRQVRTIALELSFYSDDVIRNSEGDTRAKYGTLEQHITLLDMRLKQIPGALIAYNALPDRRNPEVTLPLVAGRAVGPRLPASVSVYAYLRTEEVGGRTERVLHFAPHGTVACGHRFGDRLPPILRNPTYRIIEDVIAGRLAVDTAGNAVLPQAPAPLVLAPLGGSMPAPLILTPLAGAK
ncbi:MAG: hypothetical protein Q8S13_10620 [Dehalococcoidia bacterium]|nr:hypothetical protein [Dehalococcoidia bacterium]